ncbi:erythroblast NAD(P)(+)--arginine ADP-ribosyltransferase [Seriola aureovittata]|uniref:erythroblast NAD(P)(+)--arginine ADP-ribosyltransferase n=1 Tax=Seriola aureovittata TaxID=2871759 RepID=UPI0024BEADFE|nr:erythroblast NAD(P)(+)--arginine ADP-ribosyltransferase [Seriola aureovittata]XP_056227853.1 erythroblast NAD(P)(+)--arginine ADP-ribosyltransferase [Seriola aureovittata]
MPFKMWDGRKLLLATVVFTSLFYRLAAQETKLLDMAENAVDALYSNCHKETKEKLINSGILEKELNQSQGFKKAWNSKPQCAQQMPGGIKEERLALLAYVNGDGDFLKTFNNEVETMGVNVSTYENQFHFKSLHFLLMRSMKANKCKTGYFLAEQQYKANVGSKVRLGQFKKVEADFSSFKKFEDLDEKLVFNITSCFFVNMNDNNCTKDIVSALLLSPAEVFTVESVNDKDEKAEGIKYREIVLQHSKVESHHDCYISRSPADVSNQWLVLVLVALSLFFLNC